MTFQDAGPPISSATPHHDVEVPFCRPSRDPPDGRSPITPVTSLPGHAPGQCCAARTIRWEQRQPLECWRTPSMSCIASRPLPSVHTSGTADGSAPPSIPTTCQIERLLSTRPLRLTAHGLSADLFRCLRAVSSRRQPQAYKIVIASEELDPAACNLAPPWNTVTREAPAAAANAACRQSLRGRSA
jgi:hypothetical protein